MSEIQAPITNDSEFRPPRVDAPGFIHNLKGGFIAKGRDFPACAITGKPIIGAYATGFTMAGGRMQGGKVKPMVIKAPALFCCVAGAIKQAVETLGITLVRSLGKEWDGRPVAVNFSWAFIPPPGEVMTDA